MPRSSMTISIKPSVFFWLLDKSGWSIAEIAKKIEYDEIEIKSWKAKDNIIKLPLSKIEIISNTIDRPLSAFFMAETPQDNDKLPKDFRKHPDSSNGDILDYSKETLLAFRKASYLQQISKELLSNLKIPLDYEVPSYSLSDNPDSVAELERKNSGISIDFQIKLDNPTNAYRIWRDWLSTYGIFVFEFNIPIEDARGFCLVETNPIIIVVSKKDALRGRIFSLLHEYAHVLLRESVICNNQSEYSKNSNVAKIENWCNQFAGSFLLPKDEIIKEYNEFSQKNDDLMKFLGRASNKYKISRESILVRMKFLDLINFSDYSNIKNLFESQNQETKLKNKQKWDELKAQGKDPYIPQKSKDITIWNERGDNFVSLVLENSNKGHITERDVMNILELRVDHLMKILPS